MTTFPDSPRLINGGIVLMDPGSGAVRRIIALQYNPDTLSRSFQIKGVGESGDRSEALRVKGPPAETIKVEAELDATDQLEIADDTAVQVGLHAQLAALELMVYPASQHLIQNDVDARSGRLEIAPMETPLAVFVWGKQRVVPVRITDFSITEEAFDTSLNPIRAKVSLALRVLSVDDLGFDHRGGSLFMTYLQNKELLAQRSKGGTRSGIGNPTF